MSVPDEGYYRNASRTLNIYVFTFFKHRIFWPINPCCIHLLLKCLIIHWLVWISLYTYSLLLCSSNTKTTVNDCIIVIQCIKLFVPMPYLNITWKLNTTRHYSIFFNTSWLRCSLNKLLKLKLVRFPPPSFFNFNIHHVRVFQWNFILIKINTMHR